MVDHATLGATVGFDQQGRVVVTDILDDSDAYRRGLRYDDEIISFAGRAISTPNGFKNVLGILPKGWRVPLSFRRDGKRHDVLVRLAGMHSEAELLANTEGRPKELEPDPAPNDPHKPKTPKPEGPEKTPQQPGDQPALPLAQAPPAVRELTEVVKAHFEAKHGYANYFFNHQQRDRIYGQWRDRFGGKRATGVWALSGALSGGGSFHLELTDNHAQLQVPSGDSKWLDTEGITSSLPPAGSGGLLPALYLWRRLAVLGTGALRRRPLSRHRTAARSSRAVRRTGSDLRRGRMPLLLRPQRGHAPGPGTLHAGKRRSLRDLLLRLPFPGRPPVARTDGSAGRR